MTDSSLLLPPPHSDTPAFFISIVIQTMPDQLSITPRHLGEISILEFLTSLVFVQGQTEEEDTKTENVIYSRNFGISVFLYIGLDTDSADRADRSERIKTNCFSLLTSCSPFIGIPTLTLLTPGVGRRWWIETIRQSDRATFNLVLIISYFDPI